ncbi:MULTISPECIES: NAD+ synthase [unclassified Variovorax]|uniref:NAD+ synthase n=1 Tax=unclassified Variovorax TaxID=663243 RepID=UPI0013160247|nr:MULTISPECIES: NAD+ synthase [unclassified Variovorax]VTU42575.1 Glutamine-dependent NAD(+) synthetase [Variovorax sp. PBL-H6]VTU43835.1 Glutamine-dependent NAD(+) synthetase [Variovorax sp. SRS16]VTU43900.1 Glutamine-dependent NAD(+) synthetase [Variovorax sp. PBL-E5]
MIRITSAQLNLTVGDIFGNVAKMAEAAAQAAAASSDLVVFPELALTGYYPGDLLDEPEFLDRVELGFAQLLTASKAHPELTWVFGLPRRRSGPGKQLHNALSVIRDGKECGMYAKQLLPTYGVFDERRHFEPGPDRSCVVNVQGTRVGLLICEDGWNNDGSDYIVNPFNRLRDAAPNLIVSLNASPCDIGKREVRHRVFGQASAVNQLPIFYVNHIGGHDQLVYDGGSFAVVPTREGYTVQYEAARFMEEVRTLGFDNGRFFATDDKELPVVSVEGLPTMEFYRQQIVLGLRDYARRCGFKQVVVGSSGGIDSALTLALAVEALGPENVSAITMPSKFSSTGSVSDSETLCRNLGIPLLTHAIKDVVSAFGAGFEAAFGQPLKGLPLENLQARARGTILMEYSNAFGHLLLTTGNKSEISVGYCTLYGDTNGGLGLIGDLYKTEVFELCRHINATAEREIIPVAIIEKPPSAELAPDQKDTDSLPPYEVLDDVLRMLIEGGRLASDEKANAIRRVSDLMETEEGRALVLRVRTMIARNEYKRRQAPPIIRVRARAFGSGRQMPIAAKVV